VGYLYSAGRPSGWALAHILVVLDLVSSVLRQEIGWEGRLRNDLFCVKWDVKPELSQSILLDGEESSRTQSE